MKYLSNITIIGYKCKIQKIANHFEFRTNFHFWSHNGHNTTLKIVTFKINWQKGHCRLTQKYAFN